MKTSLAAVTFFLLCCNDAPKDVIIRMVSFSPKRDTVWDGGKKLILNEYYPFQVENYAFDTIYFGMQSLGNNYPTAIFPSTVAYSNLNGFPNAVEYSNNGVILKVEKIPKSQKKLLLFSLPNFGDTTTTNDYLFFFWHKNSGDDKYEYFHVDSLRENAFKPIKILPAAG